MFRSTSPGRCRRAPIHCGYAACPARDRTSATTHSSASRSRGSPCGSRRPTAAPPSTFSFRSDPNMTMPVLTPNAVQQSLQNNGLAALGFTTVALGTRWADATPATTDFDAAALTLTIAGTVRAPFTGIRENLFRDATSTLAAAVGATDTSLVLEPGTGTGFPSPVSPPSPAPQGRVRVTLSNSSGSKVEVVECTARSGDTLTVVRGAMGSAKQAFDVGDRVSLRLALAQRVHEFYDASGTALDVNATV